MIAPDPIHTLHLLRAVLGVPGTRAALFAQPMTDAMAVAGITSRLRASQWLAQIGHETGRLRYMREIWGPTAQQRRYEPVTSLSRRLGNTQPGDGQRFAGHGAVQTTGRANHRAVTQRLRRLLGASVPDFEARPDLLARPDWACLSAADYWLMRGLNTPADRGDVLGATRLINGGTNGLADRQMLFTRALGVMME